MSEAAHAQRQNGEAELKVTFGQEEEGTKSYALVRVFQQGKPHPKGIDAVVVSHFVQKGTAFPRELKQEVTDAAIDFVRGKANKFSIEEFEFSKADMDKNGTEYVPCTGEECDTNTVPRDMQVPPPADYPAAPDTPVGATAENPTPSGVQSDGDGVRTPA